MIDMHCHLLPGVDDGVQDMNEAIAQFKEGLKYGVKEYILTPHYRPTKEYIETTESLQQKLDELSDALKKNDVDVTLYLGREIDETKDLKKLLEDHQVATINGTSTLLVDFGVNKAEIPEYIYEAKLLGYSVIVAHVERYKYVSTLECYKDIKKEGGQLQMNVSSIVSPRNNRMKKKVRILLKNKLIDFVATDAHRHPDSYKQFQKAFEMVSKRYGKEYAEEIFVTNPATLL